ncbi:MAG: hypothetical protein FWB90_05360 [Fibromonadales bacterium]|nr:hypothetical protein [Fibromonadales bacterium]
MEKHPLHKTVGELLKKFAKDKKFETRLDSACGGDQLISLFSCSEKSRESRLCCVDAMLLKNNKVAVVIEIEESDIKPTQICGKYLTTALSKEYNYADKESVSIEKESIDFIQILDTSELKQNSRKEKQFKNIEQAIKDNLCGCVKNYNIIYIDWEDEREDVLEKKMYDILSLQLVK